MSEKKSARRDARALALQMLYELDLTHHTVGQVVISHLADADRDHPLSRFVEEIVRGVSERRDDLDTLIAQVAPEWPVAQMAPVDRSILRMAIYELSYYPDTPLRVAINEAVELARIYGSDSSPRFVNGALGTFAKDHLDRDEG
ncbi:MAG: transcription antitermination factor NusB [Anaerolineales bacterium]|nr:transcription antitermination factor NusB [Anaerolineales bacterium]